MKTGGIMSAVNQAAMLITATASSVSLAAVPTIAVFAGSSNKPARVPLPRKAGATVLRNHSLL